MKKCISVFIVFAMLAGLLTFASSATGEATIKVGTASAVQGETVSLTVDFLNNPGINTYTLSIDYDTTRLSLDSVTSEVAGQFAYVRKAVWATSGDSTYSGTYLTLNFTVLDNAENGEAYVRVSYNAGDICNYNEDDVNFAIENGTVTVGRTSSPVISVSSVEAAQGEKVSVTVDFLDNPGINTYTLSIDYDTTRLSLDSVTSEVAGQFAYVRKAVWATSGDSTYSGTYLTLNFTVLDDAPEGEAYVTVSYRIGDICNYEEEDVDFTIVPGVITVSVSEEILFGDIDGDGEVTARDMKAYKKFILETIGENDIVFRNADIDGDGEITSRDIKAAKKILLQ